MSGVQEVVQVKGTLVFTLHEFNSSLFEVLNFDHVLFIDLIEQLALSRVRGFEKSRREPE
jgi:hypothetical protein